MHTDQTYRFLDEYRDAALAVPLSDAWGFLEAATRYQGHATGRGMWDRADEADDMVDAACENMQAMGFTAEAIDAASDAGFNRYCDDVIS